jgi:hypothetical protein
MFWLSSSQGEKINDLDKRLHFYLPFEEELALYLYNLEFPLSKDDLYQV